MKKKKLYAVFTTLQNGKKQLNCFEDYNCAKSFCKFARFDTNVKKVIVKEVDAIFPIINYAKNYIS